jgi:hypothetical protein
MRKKAGRQLTSVRSVQRIAADLKEQAPNNSYAPPTYYENIDFKCADCGRRSTWSALQQKQYYEEWKKPIYGTSKYCRECRQRRTEDKRVQQEKTQVGKTKKRIASPPID